MRRIVFIVLTLWVMFNETIAQTTQEWTSQKKTQKEYLLKQIAALKVYLKYLKQGYRVVSKGLNLVGDIKDGNFKDHSSYFESLNLVNGWVKKSPKISAILSYQSNMLRDFKKLVQDCNVDETLSKEEIEYVQSVYKNILALCEDSISEMNSIITDNASQMTDEARISRIDKIYIEMEDKYSFTKSFCNSTRMLMMERAHEENEISVLDKLNTGS